MHPAGPMNALFKDLDTFAVISSTCEYMCGADDDFTRNLNVSRKIDSVSSAARVNLGCIFSKYEFTFSGFVENIRHPLL